MGRFSEETHCTLADQKLFRQLRSSGKITMFRVKVCEAPGCTEWMPTTKTYCSLACKEVVEPPIVEKNDDDDYYEW